MSKKQFVVVVCAWAAIHAAVAASGEGHKTYKMSEAASLKVEVPVTNRVKGQIDQIRVNDISAYEVKDVIMTESVESNPLKDQGHYHKHYNADKHDGYDKYNYYDKYGRDKYNKYDNKFDSKYDKYDKYDHKYDNKYDNKYDHKYDNKYDNEYDKHDKNDNKYDKYNKYNKYDDKKGKFDDKYDKHDKYDKQKYDKHDDKNKYDDYCHPTHKKLECTAFVLSADATNLAQLWKSVSGVDVTLASTFSAATAVAVHLFSNWARGGYCPNRDLEFGIGYDNTTTSVGRMRYEKDAASLVYEHLTAYDPSSFVESGPFVTDILIPKGIFYIDAYQTQFDDSLPEFVQIDINPVTNQQVKTTVGQTACFDSIFFNKECSRWLCVGNKGGQLTSYMKDPSTGQYEVPKDINNNPQAYSSESIWYTGTLLCGRMRFAAIGYDAVTELRWSFVRSKLSLKYPYFKGVEEFYNDDSVAQGGQSFIYTPAHTNTVYACVGEQFWKFDNAYTAPIPITPAVSHNNQWVGQACVRITAFKECSNEVYVLTNIGSLYYSQNGGASFALVSNTPISGQSALVGFAVPT